MKIVLDTNVVIAALIAEGTCYELLEHCIRRHTLITSSFILAEVQEKLVEKFGYDPELATEVVSVLRSRMRTVPLGELETPVCRDPDDDHILATALGGECDCIITGDKDLLVLQKYKNIEIFSPRDFFTCERV